MTCPNMSGMEDMSRWYVMEAIPEDGSYLLWFVWDGCGEFSPEYGGETEAEAQLVCDEINKEIP